MEATPELIEMLLPEALQDSFGITDHFDAGLNEKIYKANVLY